MFHRRLILLAVAFFAAVGALAVRLVDLTVARHEGGLSAAREKLVAREWIPSTRGRILDRKGRVLAQDRPAYAVAVDFRVLTGEWPGRAAPGIAKALDPDTWALLPAEQRRARIEEITARLEQHVVAMWARISEVTGVGRDAIAESASRVIDRVERAQEAVTLARVEAMLRERAEAGLAITDEARQAINDRAGQPIVERLARHVVIGGLPDQAGFALLRLASAETTLGLPPGRDPVVIPLLPGVEVVDVTERSHPFDRMTVAIDRATLPGPLKGEGFARIDVVGSAWHVLGDTRPGVQADDIERREAYVASLPASEAATLRTEMGADRGAYRETDAVGRTGIERAAEPRLRGLRGVIERDRVTGAEQTLSPAPGRDMTLTIDAMLQARVTAALHPGLGLTRVQAWHGEDPVHLGQVRNGAAVVLDIDTGDILALVSTPSPGDQGAGVDAGAGSGEAGWSPDPFVNRAIAAAYPPGSIAKALILTEAVTQRRLNPGHGVVCTGHLLENRPDLYRCWIYKRYQSTHSPTGEPVRPAEAIKVSCNIFFYEMGRRLGVDGVARAFADFGLGEPFNLGIGPEWPGAIGSAREPGIHPEGLTLSDAILMGIGQGPVSWTPLHAADAYATIARGGVRLTPRLIRDGAPPVATAVELDQQAVADAMAGLRAALQPGGTGHDIAFESAREPIFNLPGVDIWGKTGTATAPNITFDADGDGPDGGRVVRSGDHAWFVTLAGPAGDRPHYAVAVIIEYGGSGGRVAGPVMNQVLHALADEGYLPGGTTPAPAPSDGADTAMTGGLSAGMTP